MRRATMLALLAAVWLSSIGPPAFSDVDLTVLPDRDTLQLTIYNSADLTLVKEVRTLTLAKGDNVLSFAWSGTLIDPTSVSLRAPRHEGQVELVHAAYPPRIQGKAVWTVRSEVEGPVPVEITYFISGVSWRAFYMGTLSEDETSLRIDGYVRVANRSGDDFPEAATRLVVGKVSLLDQIAALARRTAPYGTPLPMPTPRPSAAPGAPTPSPTPAPGWAGARRKMEAKEKAILKEGLSEYFLYSIEGTETIPNGWSKRLPSFRAPSVPVVNLFKYEEERWGPSVRRFLLFKNDKSSKLGETPLPDGTVMVYRTADASGRLSFEGATATKYIPVDQKAELDLGAARKVIVEPVLMEQRFENHTFDRWGNVDGWDEVQAWKITAKNRRAGPVRLEITRNMRHQFFELKNAGDFGNFEKDDLDTVKYTLELKPGEERSFAYAVTFFEGVRRNRR